MIDNYSYNSTISRTSVYFTDASILHFQLIQYYYY